MSRSTGLILVSFCLLAFLTACSEGATCYGYSGFQALDQQVCPDSDACCGKTDTCMPNRLCKSENNRDNVLVRGPCRLSPWDRSDCAQICVFNETESNTGFRDFVFPRVEVCGSNTYCCRQGSASCCDSSSISKVYLDDNGLLLSAAPSQTSSTSVASSTETTSTTASSSQTVSATTATQEPASTSSASESPSDSGSETIALKVGLGVGIPLAAIVTGLATWFFFRKRRNKNSNASELPVTTAYANSSAYQKSPHTDYQSMSPAGRNEMHEMPARPDEGWDGNPRELMGSEVRDSQYR